MRLRESGPPAAWARTQRPSLSLSHTYLVIPGLRLGHLVQQGLGRGEGGQLGCQGGLPGVEGSRVVDRVRRLRGWGGVAARAAAAGRDPGGRPGAAARGVVVGHRERVVRVWSGRVRGVLCAPSACCAARGKQRKAASRSLARHGGRGGGPAGVCARARVRACVRVCDAAAAAGTLAERKVRRESGSTHPPVHTSLVAAPGALLLLPRPTRRGHTERRTSSLSPTMSSLSLTSHLARHSAPGQARPPPLQPCSMPRRQPLCWPPAAAPHAAASRRPRTPSRPPTALPDAGSGGADRAGAIGLPPRYR